MTVSHLKPMENIIHRGLINKDGIQITRHLTHKKNLLRIEVFIDGVSYKNGTKAVVSLFSPKDGKWNTFLSHSLQDGLDSLNPSHPNLADTRESIARETAQNLLANARELLDTIDSFNEAGK